MYSKKINLLDYTSFSTKTESRNLNLLEYAVFSLSVLFLSMSLWEICLEYQPPIRDFFLLGYVVIFITLLFVTFSSQPKIFLAASLVQAVYIFFIIVKFRSRFGILEIILILTVSINIILRMTPRLSLPSVIVILLTQFSSALFFNESYNVIAGINEAEARDIFFALIIEFTIVLLFQTLIIYREKLVLSQDRLENCLVSLKNLEAANESFISHITEIKEESAEEERNHITRELHDSLGYAMTNIIMMMNATFYLKDESKKQEYCHMTKDLAATTMDDTRNTLYRLRKIGKNKKKKGLEDLYKLCQNFQLSTGIITSFNPGNMPLLIPERIYTILFRFLQVGFINALKHGKAGEIKISLWISQTELSLVIWNEAKKYVNISGLINKEEGIGLTGIRERLLEFNGCLEKRITDSEFELIITIPVKELNFG